jgi:ribosome biogenesis GTPase
LGDVASVGDWVKITCLDDGTGIIEEIEPRKSLFVRMAPLPQGTYQQILVANLDQVLFVFACAQPAPRYGMLDRYLVIAEKQKIPATIVANKVDLVGVELAQQMFELYSQIEYKVIYTSARTGEGINEVKKLLRNKISLLTGPSGVGKTSLLNAVQPGLGLEVRNVSKVTKKGRHTTVFREMFPLEEDGYVVDTPGWKALALWDIEPEELDGYFPEFRSLVKDCQFSDCTHVHEPGCAVLAALDRGDIFPSRYQSYIRMRFGEDENVKIG